MKKVLVSGGTGFVGKKLVKSLIENNFDVYVLTRSPQKLSSLFDGKVKGVEWKSFNEEFSTQGLTDLYAVINLVGESIIAKRWSQAQKQQILDSRVISTKTILSSLKNGQISPEVFISTSAIGIYGKTYLKEVCEKWEEALIQDPISTRKVIFRLPIILDSTGGMIKQLSSVFKLNLGGPLGSGKMKMHWIHLDDLVTMYLKFLSDESLSGTFNIASPFSCTNKKFTKVFGKLLGKTTAFSVPKLAIKIFKGELAEHLFEDFELQGQGLNELKVNLKYPTIELALKSIVSKL